jgi:hypothetical protein
MPVVKGGSSIGALVFAIGIVSVSARAATNEGPLAVLYHDFLSGSNRSGYVTFDRVVNYPPIPSQGASVGSIRRASSATNYVSFCWDGPQFVVCESPITATDRPSRGMRWYGYDGTNYWHLFTDNSVTYRSDDKDLTRPLSSSSDLMVIPKTEAAGQPASSAVSSITELGAECRRVVQFGFSIPMERKPCVWKDTLSVESGGLPPEMLKFKGALEHPEQLEPNSGSDSVPRVRAAVDFARNSLSIQKLNWRGSSWVYSNQYVVMSVRIPEPPATNPVFSWQSYKVGGVINASLMKGGNTVRSEITPDGELRPKAGNRPTYWP